MEYSGSTFIQFIKTVRDLVASQMMNLAYVILSPEGRDFVRNEIREQFAIADGERMLSLQFRMEHDRRCLSREPGLEGACDCAFWTAIDKHQKETHDGNT